MIDELDDDMLEAARAYRSAARTPRDEIWDRIDSSLHGGDNGTTHASWGRRMILPLSITFVVVAVGAAAAAVTLIKQQEAPLFELVEDLRIVSSDSSLQTSLTKISDLTVLSDGSIVTFHGGSVVRGEQIMRIFDSTGRFVRTIGGKGDGPGEFRDILLGGSVGDHIWADDSKRVSTLSRDGKLVSTFNRTRTAGRGRADPRLVALLAGNKHLIAQPYYSGGAEYLVSSAGEPDPDSVVYFVVYPTFEEASIVRVAAHPYSGKPSFSARLGGRGRMLIGQELAGTVVAAVSDGGALFVVGSDAPVWGGRPGQLRFNIGGASGSVSQFDVSFPPQRVPSDYIAQRAGRHPVAAEQAELRQVLRAQFYVPDYYPVLRRLMVGRDSSIWISPAHEPLVWRVIVSQRLQMRVRTSLPPRTRVMRVSRSKVWTTTEDSLGVPSVIRYSVVRAR